MMSNLSRNNRFHLRIASTLGINNIQEAPKLVNLAHSIGVKDIMFGAMDLGTESLEHLTVDTKKSIFYLKKAKKLADKFKIRFSCPKRIGGITIDDNHNWYDFKLPIDKYAPFKLEESNPYEGQCGYPWIQTVIRSNGKVVSCCQREYVMGDLNNHSFRRFGIINHIGL